MRQVWDIAGPCVLALSWSALGCGEDATNSGNPEPALRQGAVALHVSDRGGCPMPEGWVNIPDGPQPVSAASINARLLPASVNAVIVCNYQQQGDGFRFTKMSIFQALTARVELELPAISPGQSDVSGNLRLGPLVNPSATPCKFSVAPSPLAIGPGKIWASVTCESLSEADAGSTCAIDEGYFVFENCPLPQ